MTSKIEAIPDESMDTSITSTQQDESVKMVTTEIESKSELNEFSYLETGGFSTERYKIEIRNMPKYYGISELKKLLNQKLDLKTGKIKTPRRGSSWIYVCFHSEEERTKAIEALQGHQWKGKTLNASIAQPTPDPLIKKRKLDSNDTTEANGDKKAKLDSRTQEEKIRDSTIPYWNMPYKEQIEIKQKEMHRVLQKYGNELWKTYPSVRNYIETERKLHNGLICPFDSIKTAKKIEGYRNKCEFTVGMDDETKLPTVGFRIGSYVTGVTGVAPVDKLCHISDEMKKAVLLFQEFVRSSDLKVYSPIDHSGNWSTLMIRQSSTTGDLMLVIGANPKDLSEEKLSSIKEDLVKYFSSDEAKNANVSSLYFQQIVRKKSGEAVPKATHLWGETHIYETIHGIKFRVSPEAFFQINSEGAEILYQTAIDMAQPQSDTTILDVCCGTGTIGLCFSKHCGQVLGLEMVPEAITDAKFNATANGITNADFFVGKAEEVLFPVVSRATNKDVTAIIDPPRAGLHAKAIVLLRKMKQVNKLVYVSCDPSAATKNFVDLGRAASKTMHGDPFILTKAVAVDMFPFTKHTELVMLFERKNPEEFIAYNKGSKQDKVIDHQDNIDKSVDNTDTPVDNTDKSVDNTDTPVDNTDKSVDNTDKSVENQDKKN